MSLTRAGQIMLEHARRCLADLEQMHADLAPYAEGVRSQIALFANSSAIASFLPDDLGVFLRVHPDVRVALEERLSHDIVRAVAEGLGVGDSRVVSSPTFVLIQEYDGRLPIYHFDAYRLRSPAEFSDLGAHEYFEGQGVCFVEWGDRVEACLPREHLRITIVPTGETSRRFVLEGRGGRYEALARECTSA